MKTTQTILRLPLRVNVCRGLHPLPGLLLVLFCMGHQSYAQDRVISGRIVGRDDQLPLAGVNILVTGTNRGTVTDADGKYSIALQPEDRSVTFSFVGYLTQAIQVGAANILDLSLEPDVRLLSELVVTGTGVPTEKRKLAFALETVSTKDLPAVPTASIDQALVGRVAGAQISSIDGTPGSEMSIVLRGINTINRGTMPLIMVDGVQMGVTTLSAIDPASIERVEVIQGAAASTLYGAQGANGVIQLFTKRGKAGRINVDFSSSISQSKLLNVGGLSKAQLHGYKTNANNEILNAVDSLPLTLDPATLLYSGDVGYSPLDPNTTFSKPYDQNLRYIDHFDVFLQPAILYSNAISVSSGSERFDVGLTISNAKQQSNFKGDGYNDRTNLTSNFSVELVKGLRLRSSTQLIRTVNTVSMWQKQDFGNGYNSYFLFQTRPFVDYEQTDHDGNHGIDYGLAAGINGINPLYIYQYSDTKDERNDVMQSFTLNYDATRFLSVEAVYGINRQEREVRYKVSNQSLNANSDTTNMWIAWRNWLDNTGEITVFDHSGTFQNFKTTATGTFDLEKDFHSSLPLRFVTTAAFDYRSDLRTRYGSTAMGMPLIPPQTSTRGTRFEVFEDYREEFVTYGYLVNQRVEYGEIAGMSGGFRTDYSSAFGSGTQPFTFPRADGYVNLSALRFWDAGGISSVIVDMKLRAAYGTAGIQPRPFDRQMTLLPRTLGNTNALYFSSTQSNPQLNVEVSREFEVGTDVVVDGFRGKWLSRANLSATWWQRVNDGIILAVNAPPSSGITGGLDNAVSIGSEGIQATLSLPVFVSAKLKWNTVINYSRQESMFTHVSTGQVVVGNRVIHAGESVGELYGWRMIRNLDERKPDGTPFIESPSGQYEVASNGWVVHTASKQPFISSERYPLGDPNPNYIVSFMNDLSAGKWLTIAFQFDWHQGSRLYNNTKQWMYRDGIHSDYAQPISIADSSAAWSAFYRGTYTPTAWEKNYFYEDASFLRLRNASIGVDLVPLLKIQGLHRLRLVASGRNLWTVTPYTGLDPEISTYGYAQNTSSSLDRGFDDNSLGNFRTYQLTLDIGF